MEAATQAYLDTVPPEKRTRSDAYFEGGYWLILWRFLWSSLALLVLLHFRLSASLRDFAARLTRFGFLQPAIYWVGFALFTFLFALPLAVYADFVREHHYGLSTQSFGAWFTDALKVLGLDLVIGAMGAAVFYAALRRAGRRWWLWGSGIALVFVVLVAMIGPVYIAPLFNTYQPVGDPAIREPVLSLARANGIDAAQVWQMDASRQTTRISANVSGMLGTERITLNDNLLVRTSREGVLAVMGHEMALRAQSHLRAAGVVRAPDRHRLWRHRRGLSRSCQAPGPPLADPGSGRPGRTAAHRSALQRYFFLITPLTNSIIRSNEYEADVFGLNAARQPEGRSSSSTIPQATRASLARCGGRRTSQGTLPLDIPGMPLGWFQLLALTRAARRGPLCGRATSTESTFGAA